MDMANEEREVTESVDTVRTEEDVDFMKNWIANVKNKVKELTDIVAKKNVQIKNLQLENEQLKNKLNKITGALTELSEDMSK